MERYEIECQPKALMGRYVTLQKTATGGDPYWSAVEVQVYRILESKGKMIKDNY